MFVMRRSFENKEGLGAKAAGGFTQGFLPAYEKGLEQIKKQDELPKLADKMAPLFGGDLQKSYAFAQLAQTSPDLAKEYLRMEGNQAFAQAFTGQEGAGFAQDFSQPSTPPPLSTRAADEDEEQAVQASPQVPAQAPKIPPAAFRGINPASQIQYQQFQRQIAEDARKAAIDASKLDLQTRKIVQPFIDKTLEKHNVNQSRRQAVQEMRQLIASGELSGPGKAAFVQKLGNIVGTDLSGLMLSPEDQAFKGAEVALVGGLKELIGGRMAVQEFEALRKSIPSLLNTNEGKEMLLKIIENHMAYDDRVYDSMQEILNKRGGRAPSNLSELAMARADKKTKKLEKELKNITKNIEDEVSVEVGDIRFENGQLIYISEQGPVVFGRAGQKNPATIAGTTWIWDENSGTFRRQ